MTTVTYYRSAPPQTIQVRTPFPIFCLYHTALTLKVLPGIWVYFRNATLSNFSDLASTDSHSSDASNHESLSLSGWALSVFILSIHSCSGSYVYYSYEAGNHNDWTWFGDTSSFPNFLEYANKPSAMPWAQKCITTFGGEKHSHLILYVFLLSSILRFRNIEVYYTIGEIIRLFPCSFKWSPAGEGL